VRARSHDRESTPWEKDPREPALRPWTAERSPPPSCAKRFRSHSHLGASAAFIRGCSLRRSGRRSGRSVV